MKYQALFSSKQKSEKIKESSIYAIICEIRPNFKMDLIKFFEIVTETTFKLPKGVLKPYFIFNKLLNDTIKCDFCLLFHKIS